MSASSHSRTSYYELPQKAAGFLFRSAISVLSAPFRLTQLVPIKPLIVFTVGVLLATRGVSAQVKDHAISIPAGNFLLDSPYNASANVASSSDLVLAPVDNIAEELPPVNSEAKNVSPVDYTKTDISMTFGDNFLRYFLYAPERVSIELAYYIKASSVFVDWECDIQLASFDNVDIISNNRSNTTVINFLIKQVPMGYTWSSHVSLLGGPFVIPAGVNQSLVRLDFDNFDDSVSKISFAEFLRDITLSIMLLSGLHRLLRPARYAPDILDNSPGRCCTDWIYRKIAPPFVVGLSVAKYFKINKLMDGDNAGLFVLSDMVWLLPLIMRSVVPIGRHCSRILRGRQQLGLQGGFQPIPNVPAPIEGDIEQNRGAAPGRVDDEVSSLDAEKANHKGGSVELQLMANSVLVPRSSREEASAVSSDGYGSVARYDA